MSPLEQRMLIYWHIRYFCDKEQRMKDRILFLDTDMMPANIAHAFMFRVEAENLLKSYDLIKFKRYFIEVASKNYHIESQIDYFSSLTHTSGPYEYFEAQNGEVLSKHEVLRLLHKKPIASRFPEYFNRYRGSDKNSDAEFDQETLRQLTIFSQNYNKMIKFSLQLPALSQQWPFYSLHFHTPESEVEAFVQTFRKLYLTDKQAKGSFGDVCDELQRYPDCSLSILSEDAKAYFETLKKTDIRFIAKETLPEFCCSDIYKLLENYPEAITIHDFIQLFLNTKFMHNPSPQRKKLRQSLIAFLERRDAEDILLYIFYSILFCFQILFKNIGQVFNGVLLLHNNSQKTNPIGLIGYDSHSIRKKAVFEKMKRSLAKKLWIQDARPEQGAYSYEDKAEKQILLALGRVRI